jgi:hypothetical protein
MTSRNILTSIEGRSVDIALFLESVGMSYYSPLMQGWTRLNRADTQRSKYEQAEVKEERTKRKRRKGKKKEIKRGK